jgi:hypothetical protein
MVELLRLGSGRRFCKPYVGEYHTTSPDRVSNVVLAL